MKIAFVLFDELTSLDFVGFYEVMTSIKKLNLMDDLSWDTNRPLYL